MNHPTYMIALSSLACLLAASACSSSTPEEVRASSVEATVTAQPAPTTPARPGTTFDATLMQTAQTAKGVTELRVYLDEQGVSRKLAVYHGDASKMPKPVLALAEKMFPGATILAYEHEYYAEFGAMYELELKTASGEDVELSAKADGTLHYVERAFDQSTKPLDEKVKQAIAAKLPGASIDEVEVKEGPQVYELRVKVNAKSTPAHYFVFDKQSALQKHLLRFPAHIEIPAP